MWLPLCRRCRGLSPRGRGKRAIAVEARERERSIPAWAGETVNRIAYLPAAQVYPRVGGGNGPISSGRSHAQGLSPRGRGKQF